MGHKRPFDDEVVDGVSPKQSRQSEPCDEFISCNERTSKEADIMKHHDSGECSIRKGEVEYHGARENGSSLDILREGGARFASLSHWSNSSTSMEDKPPEDILQPFNPGCYNFDRPFRLVCSNDDVYHCLIDNPPRKQVPIGPEHQADIPTWGENTSNGNLNGTCIMLTLESPSVVEGISKAGDGRGDCRCPDQGSIRCVRVHIAEARDKLKRDLGEDTFVDLGFNDMGEVVADKWANEEEQLFHKVVYTTPVSLGKNFWDALSAVFPSRTHMEIVSYYFNVFMLRKRAEQNRCDPMNIDSDNDEWQGNDDDEGSDEEDDDSGIESPIHHDGLVFHQNGLHVGGYEEDDGDLSDDALEIDEGTGEGRIHNFDADSGTQFSGKKSDNEGENDVQDGSCTSSDSGASLQGGLAQNDRCHNWHDYIMVSTDGYMNCSKSKVDFLPTCSMIEEVFGGDFDSKDQRW